MTLAAEVRSQVEAMSDAELLSECEWKLAEMAVRIQEYGELDLRSKFDKLMEIAIALRTHLEKGHVR